jgi:hypothetical protein
LQAQRPKYDKFADSTKYELGRTDRIILAAPGSAPTCVTNGTVLFEEEVVDVGNRVATANTELTRADTAVLRVLTDTARFTIPGAVTRRNARLGEGEFVLQYVYPLSATQLRAILASARTEAADNRGHHLRRDQKAFAQVPSVCSP